MKRRVTWVLMAVVGLTAAVVVADFITHSPGDRFVFWHRDKAEQIEAYSRGTEAFFYYVSDRSDRELIEVWEGDEAALAAKAALPEGYVNWLDALESMVAQRNRALNRLIAFEMRDDWLRLLSPVSLSRIDRQPALLQEYEALLTATRADLLNAVRRFEPTLQVAELDDSYVACVLDGWEHDFRGEGTSVEVAIVALYDNLITGLDDYRMVLDVAQRHALGWEETCARSVGEVCVNGQIEQTFPSPEAEADFKAAADRFRENRELEQLATDARFALNRFDSCLAFDRI